VTVRGRPHSPAVGDFVRESVRTQWLRQPAIAVRKASNQVKASGGAEALDDAD